MAQKAKTNAPPFDDLNKAEKQFIEDTRNGAQTNFAFGWNTPTIRPQLIRWLAENSQNREIVAAAGIRLNGAKITSDQQVHLDLDNLDIAVPLWLDNCEIHGLKLRASTKEISLQGSTLTGGVDAEGAQVEGRWFMRRAKTQGCFNILDAIIEGQFLADGAEFTNKSNDAIVAAGVSTKSWCMNNANIQGSFNIAHAKIEGQFNAEDTVFSNKSGDAITAFGVTAKNWFMRGAAANARPCKVNGPIDLAGCTITHIDLDDTIITVQKGVAIRLDAAKIEHNFSVSPEFSANGAIVLDRAVIPGRVQLSDAKISCHLAKDTPEIPDENWGAIETHHYWRSRQKAISAVGAKIDRLHLPKDPPHWRD